MRRGRVLLDLRTFAWTLVVVGLLLVAVDLPRFLLEMKVRYLTAFVETEMRAPLAMPIEPRKALLPRAVQGVPVPGVLPGLAVTGFGVLLLAIRPPAARETERIHGGAEWSLPRNPLPPAPPAPKRPEH